MKSNSMQALLVALGAAIITALLYYLAAHLPQTIDPVFVLVSLIESAPVAIVVLAVLKFFVYERVSFFILSPIRVSRYPKGRGEKRF